MLKLYKSDVNLSKIVTHLNERSIVSGQKGRAWTNVQMPRILRHVWHDLAFGL